MDRVSNIIIILQIFLTKLFIDHLLIILVIYKLYVFQLDIRCNVIKLKLLF